jgi:tetratricopeptide (TPR) repeat protein
MLAAVRGREDEYTQLIETQVGEAKARGEGLALTITAFLGGTLYNGLGDYDSALAAVADVGDFPEEGPVVWALTEHVEAAARLGQPERARHALDVITQTTRPTGTEWGLGIEARCRALLTDDDQAETLYREAIERLARSRIRVQHARAHLLYGEWLRRQRRRAEAREQLRTAHEMFIAMGVEAFAERAARELLATGERPRKRTVETNDNLTPQELQIARLARDGFISTHTVEYHLKKVFIKLDINSRTKLARVLPPEPGEAPTGTAGDLRR